MIPRHYDARTVWNFREIPPEYDPEEGRVVTARYIDGAVREAIEVRRGIENSAVLDAVVAELYRRGYAVTPPEVTQ